MPRKNTYGDNLREWETTLDALDAHASELPQLEGARVKLTDLIDKLRALLTEQALHRANKQQASKRLLATLKQGSKVTTMVRAVLTEFYGNTNERLAEFGIQPRRTRSHKPVPDPEPEPIEPPPPPPVE